MRHLPMPRYMHAFSPHQINPGCIIGGKKIMCWEVPNDEVEVRFDSKKRQRYDIVLLSFYGGDEMRVILLRDCIN